MYASLNELGLVQLEDLGDSDTHAEVECLVTKCSVDNGTAPSEGVPSVVTAVAGSTQSPVGRGRADPPAGPEPAAVATVAGAMANCTSVQGDQVVFLGKDIYTV